MNAMTLSAERQHHTEALKRNLASLVQQLREMPAVRQVILIGSYAAGRRDLFTDLDLVVVMDSPLDFYPERRAWPTAAGRRGSGPAGVYTRRNGTDA